MIKWGNQRGIPGMRVNQQGTTSMGEYALTIFLVIGTVVAMTTYVKRGLQARMRDARQLVISTASVPCDCDCKQAAALISDLVNCEDSAGISLAGNTNIRDQYEPYYALVEANVATDSIITKGMSSQIDYIGTFNQKSQYNTESNQYPPKGSGVDVAF